MYNLSLVIAVIVFILVAIVFGLVATVFGLVNTLTVPIETIHGPAGLYIWNGIGGKNFEKQSLFFVQGVDNVKDSKQKFVSVGWNFPSP